MKTLFKIAIWVMSILVSIKIYEFMLLHWLKKEFEKFKNENKETNRVDYSHVFRSDRLEYVQKDFNNKVNGVFINSIYKVADIFSNLERFCTEDGYVSADAFLTFIGVEDISPHFLYEKYGWDDISDFDIERDKNKGFTFRLPPLKKLDGA